MIGSNIADVWEALAATQPQAPAVVQGSRRTAWCHLDARANAVASRLLRTEGVERQTKVAQYLHNSVEYLEAVYACWKAGLVPVNTNYRYLDDELVYLWDNADVVCVMFHGVFASRIDAVRHRLPEVRLWLWVNDGTGSCPPWAEPYEDASTVPAPPAQPPWGRSGDDLHFIYTGGTTGRPKGTMWRQQDLIARLATLDGHDAASSVHAGTDSGGDPPRVLTACPLMHGTGLVLSIASLNLGGTVVLLDRPRFDAAELLYTVDRERVTKLVIVGDVFGLPLLDALDVDRSRWDLSSLASIYSSGATWSVAVKERLLAHLPGVTLTESLGSSEALGMGRSTVDGRTPVPTGRFRLGPSAVVLDESGRPLPPRPGLVGRIAVRGHVPIGYYKDPEGSAETFPILDGVRHAVPGDHVRLREDGTIDLLGRGSLCINTGGEKVFPEEVESVLRTHPDIVDAVVVGVPDPRYGSVVTAVAVASGKTPAEDELAGHVKARLAGYKIPRHVVWVPSLERAANGKADYGRWRDHAAAELGLRDDSSVLPGTS